MKSSINKIIIKALQPFHPKEIAVFGSYSRGTNSATSDIDIVVSFMNRISLFDIGKIYDVFETKYNLKIDLVQKEAMSPEFEKSISQDLKYIYKSV
ncbi:hypothetical protein LX97_01116 [Nonlabens dokdonensis]|jgi:predicted nucleotidyltransferase|uniref:DNA polymerase, beta domain protein region n=2 Tax=Nonlabens dokdonensis TaxID=328515 RepID=L7W4C8_NONDD|nr:nucleotidyltransferase domain-containing protein [Nonlabens dokdonensis]AGC76450.1 DNA polymerase, beta domain protein region [Nonlabens dokdonensis DSW-6]PZX44107.1 hypothetical protein LX97_01116 [Nonlabens dokdonensis]